MSVLPTAIRLCNSFRPFLISNIIISNRHYARVKEITVFLKQSNGLKHRLTGEVDDNCSILDMVHNNIDMSSFGLCGGLPGCTTCHVIFHLEDYKRLSKLPDELEQDLLKKTAESGPTSRLGCQVVLEEFMDGIEIMLPSKTIDNRNSD